MDSILTSIKKLLGIEEEYDNFDAELTIHINSVFTILTQIGIGPVEGFTIQDDSSTWDDFIPNDSNLESVKTYTYLRVKLLFDPPNSSTAVESINRMISEYEWRLNATVEKRTS